MHGSFHIFERTDQKYRPRVPFYHAVAPIYPFQPRHEISNNVVCATSKALGEPAHMLSLIRAFASRLIIL